MKKIIFLLVLATPFFVNGQKLKMGIMTTPQFTWMAPAGNDEVQNQGMVFGFDIGLSIEKYFTDNYAFLTGIALNNIGGIITHSDSLNMKVNEEEAIIVNGDEMKFNLQYVKIPLALKFKTNEIGYFTYFAQIGIETGINVKANISVEENDINKEDVADEVRLFNTGYLIGGGAEYSLGGNTSIVLGVQYQNGFVDILNTPEEKVVTPKIAILLGIMF